MADGFCCTLKNRANENYHSADKLYDLVLDPLQSQFTYNRLLPTKCFGKGEGCERSGEATKVIKTNDQSNLKWL